MSFFQEVIEDARCYRRPLLSQGFWAVCIHRYGMRARRIGFRPLRLILSAVHIALVKFSEVFFGIYIGANVQLGRRCCIEHFGAIIIHSEAVIGDDVRLRQGVTIGNRDIRFPLEAPVLGNRVNVGAGAKILGNVFVGDDAVIGANAVVIRNVPPNSLAVGVPAVIKFTKQVINRCGD